MAVLVMKKKSPPVKMIMAKSTALALPTELSIPSEKLGDYTWLIYGTKKIGKTSLAAQFPDALFLMFELGAKSLRIFQVDCASWKNALEYVRLLEEQKKAGTLRFKTVVIDTAMEAAGRCSEYVCEELKIDYPREDNFGKDWKKIEQEFRTFQRRILALGVGFVVLCHEKLKEAQTRTGQKFECTVPDLPPMAERFYRSSVDNCLWYHYRGRDRFLLIRGNDYAFAGVAPQVDNHFKTTAGTPVYSIPAHDHPAKTYKAIQDAFANKQVGDYKSETEQFVEAAIVTSVKRQILKEAKKSRRG